MVYHFFNAVILSTIFLYLVYMLFKSHLRILVKNTKILHYVYKKQPLSSKENTHNGLTYIIF